MLSAATRPARPAPRHSYSRSAPRPSPRPGPGRPPGQHRLLRGRPLTPRVVPLISPLLGIPPFPPLCFSTTPPQAITPLLIVVLFFLSFGPPTHPPRPAINHPHPSVRPPESITSFLPTLQPAAPPLSSSSPRSSPPPTSPPNSRQYYFFLFFPALLLPAVLIIPPPLTYPPDDAATAASTHPTTHHTTSPQHAAARPPQARPSPALAHYISLISHPISRHAGVARAAPAG